MMRRAGVVGMVMFLWVGAARGQDRPGEEEMFGGSGTGTGTGTSEPGTGTATSTTTTTATATTTSVGTGTETGTATESWKAGTSTGTAGAGMDARDTLNLGEPNEATRFSAEVAPADPLKIGGQFYWRLMSSGGQGQALQNWSLSAPALLDVYMDARPNDRVRAFALGRMMYDPTLPPNGSTTSTAASASAGLAQGSDSVNTLLGQATRGPSVALDQLWLRFDLLHTVFVTAGKQHVRWGTARFWTPTDYLHLQVRNPLLPFDARTGTTMLKLHMPWEQRGWNFYAYALPEAADATQTTGKIAGAARAEMVFGTFEGGLGVFGRQNSKAKFAGDFSFGVWDLDFYGEVAVRNAGDVDFSHYDATGGTGAPIVCSQVNPSSYSDLVGTFFPAARGSGWKPQATGGVSYTRRYADNDTFSVGAEYFYNGLGYTNVKDYLGLLIPRNQPLMNPATFFYLGRQYLGIFATAPSPYSWDNTTFTFSNLANLSDRSGITRLDYSLIVLTHVRFEAYGAVHWGQRNGEFRLAFSTSALPCPPPPQQAIDRPPALFDVGLGLRVAL